MRDQVHHSSSVGSERYVSEEIERGKSRKALIPKIGNWASSRQTGLDWPGWGEVIITLPRAEHENDMGLVSKRDDLGEGLLLRLMGA